MSDEFGTVFISYSHESPEHVKAVLDLSNRLRSDGIDCVLDQYETSPPEGWPRWMDRQINAAQYVLMICTETYFKRVMGQEKPGTGLGVQWEGGLIYQHLYNAAATNTKFIPVVFDEAHARFIPVPAQGASRFCPANESGYGALYDRLLGRPPAEKPPLGKRRALPLRPVKTNVAMMLAMPIDVDLWNAAKWHATFFVTDPSKHRPPVIGFAYKNEAAARKIFEGWNSRYGDADEFEELRLSIIEGEIANEGPGYSVHIGPEPQALMQRYKLTDNDMMFCVSRINRMAVPNPENLQRFKDAYKESNVYLLAPGVIDESSGQLKPIFELGIIKRKIYFRNASEVGKNDPDCVVVKRPGS